MSKRIQGNLFQRIGALLLVLAMAFLTCPVSVHGHENQATISFDIENSTYNVNVKFINDTLYCRADQSAQTSGCLWKLNSEQKKLYFYYDTPVILAGYSQQEYHIDNNIPWVPFFDVANQTGVYFSEVADGTVCGYRAKPLAVFYEDMDRMFGVSRYRITELILSLGGFWTAASAVSRGYAILSSMSIGGFVDAISGEMDQELYDDAFIKMLKTDETLLGTFVEAGDTLTRLGKVINMLQKSLEEDSALIELLKKLGHSESEIRDFVWKAGQVVYGEKTLNNLSDLYEIDRLTNLWDILKVLDRFTISIEADAHAVMAMQEVFANSESSKISHAAQKAVSARINRVLTMGAYTAEFLEEYLVDKAVDTLDDIFDEVTDPGSLEKALSKAAIWGYDKALSLSDKSDAIMASEVYSQIQLELAGYYYDHCDDGTPENGMMMHSVALLYLKACLAAYEMYDFSDWLDLDNTMSQSIDNATTSIKAEIKNLMLYTEEELLQNGTGEDCRKAIMDLANKTAEPTQTLPTKEELFDETYWHMSFGQSLGYKYVAKFSANGTFVARGMGSGAYKNGTYTYANGKLVIVFDIYGFRYPSTIEYSGNEEGFISLDKYPMQVGEDYYTMDPDVGSFFDEGSGIDSTYEGPLLSDGEYYGQLQQWDKNSMTVELYDFLGWNEMYMYREFEQTGKTVTVDIGASSVWLEWPWGETGNDIKCKSIDAALNTEIWGGGTTVRENCAFEICFDVKNGAVEKIVLLYAS